MELSSLPGKPVLSSTGETLGYVKSAYICKNRNLASLSCVDAEEEEFFLPAKELVFSADGILAGKTRLKAPAGTPCPVGRAVFDRSGKLLGHCSGFDPDAGTITVTPACRAAHGDGTAVTVFPLSKTAIGDILLLSPTSVTKDKKETRCAKNAIRVAKTKQNEEAAAAEREAFGLIGRQVKKQVAGVAQTGETVTPATLKRAHQNNKLLELTANTLTE